MIAMDVLLMYDRQSNWSRRCEGVGGGTPNQQRAADAQSLEYVTRIIVGLGCMSSQSLFVSVVEQMRNNMDTKLSTPLFHIS